MTDERRTGIRNRKYKSCRGGFVIARTKDRRYQEKSDITYVSDFVERQGGESGATFPG